MGQNYGNQDGIFKCLLAQCPKINICSLLSVSSIDISSPALFIESVAYQTIGKLFSQIEKLMHYEEFTAIMV
jgi:hypothetical protein